MYVHASCGTCIYMYEQRALYAFCDCLLGTALQLFPLMCVFLACELSLKACDALVCRALLTSVKFFHPNFLIHKCEPPL